MIYSPFRTILSISLQGNDFNFTLGSSRASTTSSSALCWKPSGSGLRPGAGRTLLAGGAVRGREGTGRVLLGRD